MNVGIYGRTQGTAFAQAMEKMAFDHGGRKMLYSPWHSSKEVFSKIYDIESYKQLRHKYKADQAFVSITEKMGL